MFVARIVAALLTVVVGMGAGPALAGAGHDSIVPTPTVYASVRGAGIFKNTGLVGPWMALPSLQSTSDALSLATSSPAHWGDVYAGLGDDGLYSSHNGGHAWSQTLRGRTIGALLVSSGAPQTVLAGADNGIYRSDDAGATWTIVTGLARGVRALAQAPQKPSLWYAGGTNGVWTSRDDGQHWLPLRRGLPGRIGINDLAVSPLDPFVVYAATTNGLWRKPGRGADWMQLRQNAIDGVFSSVVATSDSGGTIVYAASGNETALYASRNGGESWTRTAIPGATGSITALAVDTQQPNTGQPDLVIAGDANGAVLQSMNGGATWSSPITVAGTVGSPILALAIVHRVQLPVDGVADPQQPDVRYFPDNGGHTLSGALLHFWQTFPDGASVIGNPLTEVFIDRAHGNVPAQYFNRVELLVVGTTVVPAPLGADLLPAGAVKTPTGIDPRFARYWLTHGGVGFFGRPISPLLPLSTNDGTGNHYLVQYFQNARLEYHPEAPAGTSPVQVGMLGEEALQQLGWL